MSRLLLNKYALGIVAIAIIAAAVVVLPDLLTSPRKRYETALELEKEGKTQEAVVQLNKAVKADPNFLEARYELAMLSLRRGSPNPAELEFTRLSALGYDQSKIAIPLARAYLYQRKFQELLTKIDPSKFSGNVQAALLALQARSKLWLQDQPGAHTLVEQSLSAAPNLPIVLTSAAMVYRAEGHATESEKYIDQGLAAEPDNLELQILKAEARIQDKDYAAGAKILDANVAKFPLNWNVHVARGITNILQNDTDVLAQDVDAIIRLQPKLLMGRYLHSMLLFRREKYLDTVTELLHSPDLLKKYPPAEYLLATASLASGQASTAQSYVDKYMKVAPDDVSGAKVYAAASIQANDPRSAIAILEPFLAKYPEDNQLRLELSAAYKGAGRVADAARLLDSVKSTNGTAASGVPSPQELVNGGPDLLEYSRFMGGVLLDE